MQKVTTLETEMKSSISETQKELKRRFYEQEEKAKKSSVTNEERHQGQL